MCIYREEWQRKLQETLGQRYVKLHAASLGVLSLTIFTRTVLTHYFSRESFTLYHCGFPAVWYMLMMMTVLDFSFLLFVFAEVKDATVTTRFFPQIKTKGSVGVSFTFCGMSFLFITSHFNCKEIYSTERVCAQFLAFPCILIEYHVVQISFNWSFQSVPENTGLQKDDNRSGPFPAF